eukprot:929301-Rhodomonas_salina.1
MSHKRECIEVGGKAFSHPSLFPPLHLPVPITTMSDAPIEEAPKVSSAAALTAVVTFYGCVFLVLFILFILLRDRFRSLYNPRSGRNGCAEAVKCDLAQQDLPGISWLFGVFKATDEDLYEQCGVDAVAYVRILRIGMKLSAMGLFIAVWLIPTYHSSPREEEVGGIKVPRSNFEVTDDLDVLSMGHCYQGDPRMLGSIFACYLISGLAMYLLYQEITWYVLVRQQFLNRKTAQNHTVYLRNLPTRLQSTHALTSYLNNHFDNGITDVQLVKHVSDVEKLCKKRDKLAPTLAHNKVILEVEGTRPRLKVKSGPFWARKTED